MTNETLARKPTQFIKPLEPAKLADFKKEYADGPDVRMATEECGAEENRSRSQSGVITDSEGLGWVYEARAFLNGPNAW